VLLSCEFQIFALSSLGENRPQHLIEILAVPQKRFRSRPSLNCAHLAQRTVATAVANRGARFDRCTPTVSNAKASISSPAS